MEEKDNINNGRKKKSGDGFFKMLISGSLFSERLVLGNLGLLSLLTLFGALYIANRFHAEKIIRKSDILQKEVKELRSEAIATSAELMYISRQSEVLKLVNEKNLGLRELKEPPYKLVVKRK
jgi:hypothetical protein